MVNRQQAQFKAVLLGQFLKGPDRLFAIGRVVIDKRNFLALDVTTLDIEDVVDDGRSSRPVVAREIEDVAEHLAVCGGCTSITHRQDRNICRCRLRDQLVCDTGRQGLIDKRAKIFCRFETFNTLFSVVGCLALDQIDHFAANTAITLVQQSKIVGIAIGIRDAVWTIGTRPVNK